MMFFLTQKLLKEMFDGLVYFLRQKGMPYIKIGVTIDLPRRIEEMYSCFPLGVDVIGTIRSNDYLRIELDLHKKYKNKRLNGEWFDISEDEVMEDVFRHDKTDISHKKICFDNFVSNKKTRKFIKEIRVSREDLAVYSKSSISDIVSHMQYVGIRPTTLYGGNKYVFFFDPKVLIFNK